MTDRWRVEGQVTNMPRISYGDEMGNSRFSDRWIEDGSYLKLRSLNLNYKVPVSTSWLQGLQVWVEANNLFTLTKYLGGDPEMSTSNAVLYRCALVVEVLAALYYAALVVEDVVAH